MRQSTIIRKTKETSVELSINLDGNKKIKIETGIGFFDHMLELFAFHSGFDLTIKASGDLIVDDHHTIEDVGLALGEAFYKALGQRIGIERYGLSYVPMDDSLSRVVVDISNRPALVFRAEFTNQFVGNLSTENILEFFKSFVNEARINLHIENLYGKNTHHQIESIFKAFGRSIKDAVRLTSNAVQSTKGVL
jgi:imidazoleglycerol-phosphate dehydratase